MRVRWYVVFGGAIGPNTGLDPLSSSSFRGLGVKWEKDGADDTSSPFRWSFNGDSSEHSTPS